MNKTKKPEGSGSFPTTKSGQHASMNVSGGKAPKTSSDGFNPTKAVGNKAGEPHGYKSYEKSHGQ